MKGHQDLIRLRESGLAPKVVFIDTEETDFTRLTPDQPTVWIEPADDLTRLDLRFVVGLNASITGVDAERVYAIRDACEKAGAQFITAAVFDGHGHIVEAVWPT